MSENTPPRRLSERKERLVRSYQGQRAHQIGLMNDPKKFLVLISRGCHDRTQSGNQSKALDWLESRKVSHTIIDGMDPEEREFRNKLFDISGVRGNYPQFFFEFQDGTINFMGNFERVHTLNETKGLSEEILAQHPGLETWDKIFGSVVDSFDD